MSEQEKLINKRLKDREEAGIEIKDFEFQTKLHYIEYIDISARNTPLPDCSGGISENHWVGQTIDGKDAILHEDYLHKALLGAGGKDLLFPPEVVNFWKLNKNRKHELSPEIKERIEKMGNSFEKTPNMLVIKFKYFEDEQTWKGLLGDNSVVRLTEHWMHRNVKDLEPKYYDRYCNVNVRGKDWTPLPIGNGKDTNDNLSRSGDRLLYEESDGCSTCVIVNIMNTLHLLEDYETHDKIHMLEDNDKWLDLVHENYYDNKFPHVMCGVQILRDHRYLVRKVKIESVFQHDFVHPTLCVISNTHCIVIWRKSIIDSNHTHTLKLNRNHLDWCCGDLDPFSKIFLAYEFKPSPRIANKIGYNEK